MTYPSFSKLKNFDITIVAYYRKNIVNLTMNPHKHLYYEIMYVSSGSCEVVVDNNDKKQTVLLQKNSFIFIDSGIFHELKVQSSQCCLLNLEFEIDEHSLLNTQVIKSQCKKIDKILYNYSYIKGQSTSLLEDIIIKIQKAFDKYKTKHTDSQKLVMELLISQLFLEIDSCCDLYNQYTNIYINKTIKILNNCYSQNISVKKISDYLGIHFTYIHKLFKEQTKQTLHSYLTEIRLEKACELLLNSNNSLIHIAIEVGFNSRQSFFISFKKKYNMSPAQYRISYATGKKITANSEYVSTEIYNNTKNAIFAHSQNIIKKHKNTSQNNKIEANINYYDAKQKN